MAQPYENLIPEVQAMREATASSARLETDNTSYLAYLTQARWLKTVEEKATSLRHDADAKARREHLDDPFVSEKYYVEMLREWLVHHASSTLSTLKGGDLDASNAKTMPSATLDVTRLAASRHHRMIDEFCERYVSALSSRIAEMDADEAAFAEIVFRNPSRDPVRRHF